MNRKDKKESYPTKYIRNFVIIPSIENAPQWDKMFFEFQKLIADTNNDIFFKDLDYSKFSTNLVVYLKPRFRKLLYTPRLLKLFWRIVFSRVETSKKGINLLDIYSMSAIEASNSSFYHYITENREYFIDKYSLPEEEAILLHFEKKEEEITNFIENIKKNKVANESELYLVQYVFHNLITEKIRFQTGRSTDIDTLVTEKRLAHFRYFDLYFNYSYTLIEEDIFDTAEKEIKNICDNKKVTSNEVKNVLLKYYEKLNISEKKDFLKRLLPKLIQIELNLEQGKTLLFGLALAAKHFSGDREKTLLSDKQDAAYLLWDFAKRLEDENEKTDIYLNLIIDGISDHFITDIIFYLNNEKRAPQGVIVPEDNLKKINLKFITYCKNQFFENNKPKNIFNKDVTDNPLQILFRWRDAANKTGEIKYFNIFLEQSLESANFMTELIGSLVREDPIHETIDIHQIENLMKPSLVLKWTRNNFNELIDSKNLLVRRAVSKIFKKGIIELLKEKDIFSDILLEGRSVFDAKAKVNDIDYYVEVKLIRDESGISEYYKKVRNKIPRNQNLIIILPYIPTHKFKFEDKNIKILYFNIDQFEFENLRDIIQWTYEIKYAYLSKEEKELLIAVSNKGEFNILSVDGEKWVRTDEKENFQSNKDPAIAAIYLEAFESLIKREYITHISGGLYKLTGGGFKIARELAKIKLLK